MGARAREDLRRGVVDDESLDHPEVGGPRSRTTWGSIPCAIAFAGPGGAAVRAAGLSDEVITSHFVNCVRVAKRLFVSVLCLLAGLACAGDRGDGKGVARVRVVRGERAVEVEVGTRIDLVVLRPVASPSELRFEWPAAPEIEGEAVRFVRLRVEAPPPDEDGGVTTHHFELDAVDQGEARVTLTPRPAGPGAAQPPVVVVVTVRAAKPRS